MAKHTITEVARIRKDDDMSAHYARNARHYETGLTRIGCSDAQARNYSSYFHQFRRHYYGYVCRAVNAMAGHCRPTLLDVGCGTGDDLFRLDEQLTDMDLQGIELSKDTVAICNRRLATTSVRNELRFAQRDLATIDEQYNLITHFCVLEHVADPVQFLWHSARTLAHDGLMVFAVPNHYYWWFWKWPKFLRRKLRLRNIETHSVPLKVIRQGLCNAGLAVEEHHVYGFRPPQDYFRHAPESADQFARLLEDWRRAEQALRAWNLDWALYLHLFVVRHRQASPLAVTWNQPEAVERIEWRGLVDALKWSSKYRSLRNRAGAVAPGMERAA